MSSGWISGRQNKPEQQCRATRRNVRTLVHYVIVSVCVVATFCTALSAADPIGSHQGGDRVVIQPVGKTSRVIVTGTIEDFTGRGLILQTRRGDGTVHYSREEIREVSTTHVEQYVLGQKLFREGRVVEAERAFKESLDHEHRVWVRREILASLVKCALWQGDYRTAAQRFVAIVESDSDTFYYGLIPLNWLESPTTGSLAADARRWLSSESSAARLIGASWLWNGTYDALATRTLEELAASPQPSVQRLAQAQLWRARLRAREITGLEWQRWRLFVDGLPSELRAGPLFLIGCAAAQQHEDLYAAAAWLWLPWEYPDDRYLAAEAHVRAAEALRRAGELAAARQQFQEVQMRWSDTPAARQAKEWSDRLTRESQE